MVSRFNMHATREIVELAESLGVDSIIHEIAENRQEMDNESWAITPTAREYIAAVQPFAQASRRALSHGGAEQVLRGALRLRMIELTARWLRTGRQPLACHAGITNVHVGPRGGLWACAVQARAHRMANLREQGMDLGRALASESASRVLRSIREQGCSCPLANQLYANILMDPVEMVHVMALVARHGGAGLLRGEQPG